MTNACLSPPCINSTEHSHGTEHSNRACSTRSTYKLCCSPWGCFRDDTTKNTQTLPQPHAAHASPAPGNQTIFGRRNSHGTTCVMVPVTRPSRDTLADACLVFYYGESRARTRWGQEGPLKSNWTEPNGRLLTFDRIGVHKDQQRLSLDNKRKRSSSHSPVTNYARERQALEWLNTTIGPYAREAVWQ